MTVKVQKSVQRTTAPDIVPSVAALVGKLKEGQSFFMAGWSWKEYADLREELRDRRLRITFDNGRLEVMPTSLSHETLSFLLNLLLCVWVEEMEIPIRGGGQFTFASRELAKGLQPDQCYWITNIARVKGKKRLDFQHDPPPDLALEIEVTRTVLNRLEIYAALGVPEVWRCTETAIHVGLLQNDRTYSWGLESLVLPGFPFKKVQRTLRQSISKDHTTLFRQFRTWVREHRETN